MMGFLTRAGESVGVLVNCARPVEDLKIVSTEPYGPAR